MSTFTLPLFALKALVHLNEGLCERDMRNPLIYISTVHSHVLVMGDKEVQGEGGMSEQPCTTKLTSDSELPPSK